MTIPKQHVLLKERKELQDRVAALEEQLESTIDAVEATELKQKLQLQADKIGRLESEARQFANKLQREKRVAYARGLAEGKGQ